MGLAFQGVVLPATAEGTFFKGSGRAKERPPENKNSYGAAIRVRLSEVNREQEGDIKRLTEQAVATETALLNAHASGRSLTPTFLESLENADSLAKEAIQSLIKGQLPILRSLLAAPFPLGGVRVSGTLDTKRDKVMSEAASFIGSVVSHNLSSEPLRVNISAAYERLGRRFASWYDNSTQTVYLKPDDATSMGCHEIGHHLEFRLSFVQKSSFAFYDRRTTGEALLPLGTLYDGDELTREDAFPDRYCGKEYNEAGKRTATEIISVGVQLLYENPLALAKEDPDYFDFLIATLHGVDK